MADSTNPLELEIVAVTLPVSGAEAVDLAWNLGVGYFVVLSVNAQRYVLLL